MKNAELIRKVEGSYLVRCKYWVVCDAKQCRHYEPHRPDKYHCVFLSPVKYCGRAKGFVHDIPLSEIDSNYQCDPNLAFKAKRDADDRREKEYRKMMDSPEDKFR